MATTGYLLAANVSQIVNTNLTYSNLTNALAENDSTASGTTTSKNATATLEFSNFGFDSAVPSGATIDQVNLKIRGSATSGASVQACLLRISTTDGSETSIGTFNASLQTAETLNYTRPGGGSWTRDDLLNGTLVARARSLQPNNTTSRTYAWAWVEVEVVYSTATNVSVTALSSDAAPDASLATVSTTSGGADATPLSLSGDAIADAPLASVSAGGAPEQDLFGRSTEIDFEGQVMRVTVGR